MSDTASTTTYGKRATKRSIAKTQKTLAKVNDMSDELRERVVISLLDGLPHEKTSQLTGATINQVRSVADSIRPQLQELERQQMEDVRSLLVDCSVKSLRKLSDRLDDDDFPDKMLPSAVGVPLDKLLALAGTSTVVRALTVTGEKDAARLQSEIVGVLVKAQSRIGQTE